MNQRGGLQEEVDQLLQVCKTLIVISFVRPAEHLRIVGYQCVERLDSSNPTHCSSDDVD